MFGGQRYLGQGRWRAAIGLGQIMFSTHTLPMRPPRVTGPGPWLMLCFMLLSPGCDTAEEGAATTSEQADAIDCRTDGIGCNAPFECRANNQGIYGCRLDDGTANQDDASERDPASAASDLNAEGGMEAATRAVGDPLNPSGGEAHFDRPAVGGTSVQA